MVPSEAAATIVTVVVWVCAWLIDASPRINAATASIRFIVFSFMVPQAAPVAAESVYC
jgi:hypothetical protein